MSKYLDEFNNLNDEQRNAIMSAGHYVIKGTNESQKTTMLGLKAAHLLYEVVFAPRWIACLTYKYKRMKELKKVVNSFGVFKRAERVFFGDSQDFCEYVVSCFDNVFKEYPKDTPFDRDLIGVDLQSKWGMQLIEGEEYVRSAFKAKFPYILIDGYQHMDLPLRRVVNALAKQGSNVFVTIDSSEKDCLQYLVNEFSSFSDIVVLDMDY